MIVGRKPIQQPQWLYLCGCAYTQCLAIQKNMSVNVDTMNVLQFQSKFLDVEMLNALQLKNTHTHTEKHIHTHEQSHWNIPTTCSWLALKKLLFHIQKYVLYVCDAVQWQSKTGKKIKLKKIPSRQYSTSLQTLLSHQRENHPSSATTSKNIFYTHR